MPNLTAATSQDDANRAFVLSTSIAILGEPTPPGPAMDACLAYLAFHGAHGLIRNFWASKKS